MKDICLQDKFNCLILAVMVLLLNACQSSKPDNYISFPENGAKNVNPDTHLVLNFKSKPTLGARGKIKVYDASTDELVDSLDLSIPAGPTIPNKVKVPYIPSPYVYGPSTRTNANTVPGTPSGGAEPNLNEYQLTIIGGFTDAFHFYPVIVSDTTATIYLHHNLLEYGKTYYVLIDPEVLEVHDGSFNGISDKNEWRFTTKPSAPSEELTKIIVSADGFGDFNTVQGAIDFIPDDYEKRMTIFIMNGVYQEIVYFRNKSNVTFLGESRDGVLVQYANNEVFNPHPQNIATNEMKGTFPSRRAVFAADNSTGIHLINLTILSLNDRPAQAEGLLMNGERNIVKNVVVHGSGDALQVNGAVYLEDVEIKGFGDNVLGRGPAFFRNCELITTHGPHMWIRNTHANHGNVFVNCIFRMEGDEETTIARTNDNRKGGYPYCEAVLLNCKLHGIRTEGWGIDGKGISNIHYWEYNSVNLDGSPTDVSQRHPLSRQLKMDEDSLIIKNYSDPAYVLGGWNPKLDMQDAALNDF
ncbi:pectinesterase family protein [Marinoscillum sp. MHG1-6]|uniref:pectinesterase family protein n=1 Tax=Marinoscillum sp. MHG1-6 TaxID=2959627 RepID=UPI0021579D30|nr:pectinesterase family protein [Marinoscillum sp. MHG1-6]